CPQSCVGTAPPGHVIIDHKAIAVSSNNGSHSVSRIAADQTFDYKKFVETKYKDAIKVAGEKKNEKAKGSLTEEMNEAVEEAEHFQSSHQAVRLSVSARRRGSRLDQKSGWSDYRVELLVMCAVPEDLEKQLLRRYGVK